jgi:hypothetical protein
MNNDMEKKISKLDLTLKQRKWIKEYIETGNATEAAMRVYDCQDRETAANVGCENVRKLQMPDLMDEMGLTDVALLNMGAEGATKPVKQSITGEIFPDYNTRRGYWETLLKLKGKLRDTVIAQQFNTGEMTLEFIGNEK